MADEQPTTDPAAPASDSPPAPTPTPPDDKPLGPPGEKALADERAARKALEKELKKYADAEKARADADKSEAEKRTAAEAKVAELETQILRRDVAEEKGLTAAQARWLTGSTKEELEANADQILVDFAALTPTKPPAPKPDPSQGAKGGPAPRPTSLGAAVSQALTKG